MHCTYNNSYLLNLKCYGNPKVQVSEIKVWTVGTLLRKGKLRPQCDPAVEHVVDLSATLYTGEKPASAHTSTFSPLDHSPPHKPFAYIMLEAKPTLARVSFGCIAANVRNWNSCKRTPSRMMRRATFALFR